MTDDTPPSLDARDADFVREFLVDRNPAAACARAGIPSRKAAAMMANPDIQRAIAAQDAPSDSEKPQDAPSLQSLIDDARRAQRAAEAAGNVAGMIQATQLIARLTGQADGATDELDEPEPNDRNLARTLISLCKTPDDLTLLRAVLLVLSQKRLVATAEPHETLLRVPSELAATVGYPPAIELTPSRSPEPAEQFKRGESEVFDNGASIEYVEINTGGGLNEVCKWAIYDAAGTLHGYRRDREDAAAVAKALPAVSSTDE